MTSHAEEEEIVKLFETNGRAKDLVLFNCTSGYPVPFKDVCLFGITRMRKEYEIRMKAHRLFRASSWHCCGRGGVHLGRGIYRAPVDYVYQEISGLPAGFTVPEGLAKPCGMGQAVLACRHIIGGIFCVLNADDYYGEETFRLIHDELYTDRKTPYTRIIEHKWFQFGKDDAGSDLSNSVINREYSSEWKLGDEPNYPVNDEKNGALYAKYKTLANGESKVILGG